MKVIDGLRRRKQPEAPAVFVCAYCRTSFFYSELERVAAHLRPHNSEFEAEQKVRRAEPVMEG